MDRNLSIRFRKRIHTTPFLTVSRVSISVTNAGRADGHDGNIRQVSVDGRLRVTKTIGKCV